jgi:hypothetical protein
MDDFGGISACEQKEAVFILEELDLVQTLPEPVGFRRWN